ncbi:MAG: hypothetical protein HQK97_10335 [Nitrospirae bacterium]|nr:hypothetical protein [Nitrospirota bacterium]
MIDSQNNIREDSGQAGMTNRGKEDCMTLGEIEGLTKEYAEALRVLFGKVKMLEREKTVDSDIEKLIKAMMKDEDKSD